MTYARFERLIIGIGALAIFGTTFVGVQAGFDAYEIAAQLLLLLVLIAAAHWGRRGGMLAAAIASLVYVSSRVPLIEAANGLTADVTAILGIRMAAYGAVGILGGEACSRVKYVFARMEDSGALDDWSGVYNQRLAAVQIDAALRRWERYQEPFSGVLISLSPALTEDLRPARQRSLVRGVANLMRTAVRMVDEVARLDDGRFLLLLPLTSADGAQTVATRVTSDVCRFLGARDEAVRAQVHGTPDGVAALEALRNSIAQPNANDDGDQPTE